MKKALILGADGLLGTALVPVFSSGYQVIAWDKQDLDVTDRDKVISKIGELKPDVVLNVTAFNGVDLAEKDEEAKKLAIKINVEAVGNLAVAAEAIGATLVHFSSDYVFPGNTGKGYDESALPSPINVYGQTKYNGEKILQERSSRYYLVRLSRLFGPSGSSQFSKKSFIDLIIDKAQKENKPMKMVDEEFSCATYSPDLAKFVFKLVEEKQPFGIYHGANSGISTWYTLAVEAFKIKGIETELIPVKSDEFARPAKRPMYSELLNTKLPLQRSWAEALTEYLS